ncbi:MAG: hypothetical protein AAF202_00110 [Pseudomonadota bacterium]
MKALWTVTVLMMTVGLCQAASSDELEHKPTKIQFNAQIDQVTENQKGLQTEISSYFEEDIDLADAQDITNDEKEKVVDFVDVEVHVGGRDDKTIVDRRFNSEEEPVVASTPEKTEETKNPNL